MSATTARTWTVPILGVATLSRELSLNGRAHWGTVRRAKQALADAVTYSVLALPRDERPGGCDRAHVELHWQPKTVRPRDTDNPTLALKVCTDVLVGVFGLTPDDDSEHVTSACVIEPPGVPALWLTITEVLDER